MAGKREIGDENGKCLNEGERAREQGVVTWTRPRENDLTLFKIFEEENEILTNYLKGPSGQIRSA
jgi:hypothetical protein